jgi:hypothetical protein
MLIEYVNTTYFGTILEMDMRTGITTTRMTLIYGEIRAMEATKPRVTLTQNGIGAMKRRIALTQ